MKNSNKFCLDVSSLNEEQKHVFAKKLKEDVESYNESLGEENQKDE